MESEVKSRRTKVIPARYIKEKPKRFTSFSKRKSGLIKKVYIIKFFIKKKIFRQKKYLN